MKTSFFKDGQYCTGIDYSDRDDCVAVCDLKDEELSLLSEGYDTEFLPTDDESEHKLSSAKFFK